MKVLEFAFDSRDSGCANDYLPHNYPENSVAYTGTHDNETIAGWWKSIMAKERKLARDYLCDNYTPDKELHKCFISLVMRSSAKLCVIPMQDYMGLDNSWRMELAFHSRKRTGSGGSAKRGADCEASERDP